MGTIGIHFGTLLGGCDGLLALTYVIAAIVVSWRSRSLDQGRRVFFVVQSLVTALILLLVGAILMFQGWRLDPLLQLMVLLLNLLVAGQLVKEIVWLSR